MNKKSTFNVNGVTIVRVRIGQIAAGRFNGTKPILAFSEETIDPLTKTQLTHTTTSRNYMTVDAES